MKTVQTAKNDSWSATLTVKTQNHTSVISSLRGEDINITSNESYSQINVSADSLKDLRAYWNTLLRSLQAADSVLFELGDE